MTFEIFSNLDFLDHFWQFLYFLGIYGSNYNFSIIFFVDFLEFSTIFDNFGVVYGFYGLFWIFWDFFLWLFLFLCLDDLGFVFGSKKNFLISFQSYYTAAWGNNETCPVTVEILFEQKSAIFDDICP